MMFPSKHPLCRIVPATFDYRRAEGYIEFWTSPNPPWPSPTSCSDHDTLWWTNIAMENHHFLGKSSMNEPFSIAIFKYQRVPHNIFWGFDPTLLSALSTVGGIWYTIEKWIGELKTGTYSSKVARGFTPQFSIGNRKKKTRSLQCIEGSQALCVCMYMYIYFLQ